MDESLRPIETSVNGVSHWLNAESIDGLPALAADHPPPG
jgi:hypothetical protein